MKVWVGHGSEHSAKLVMIGRFREETKAESFAGTLKLIEDHILEEDRNDRLDYDRPTLSKEIFELLSSRKIHSLAPSELPQFALEHSVDVRGCEVTIRTDEVDISGFLKLMIDAGAKVEVYSEHDYPARE